MENVEKSSSIKDQNSTKQNENNTQPNQSDLASQGQALRAWHVKNKKSSSTSSGQGLRKNYHSWK